MLGNIKKKKKPVKQFVSFCKRKKNAHLMTTASCMGTAGYYFIECSFYSPGSMPKVRLGYVYRYVSAVLAIGYI